MEMVARVSCLSQQRLHLFHRAGNRQSNLSAVTRCHSDPGSTTEQSPHTRRAALALLSAASAVPLVAGSPAAADEAAPADLAPSALAPSDAVASSVDTSVTHRLFLDVGICPEGVRTDRTLGDKSPFCTQPEPLGRLVLEFYGNAAPGSVANVVAAVQAGAYDGTALTKVLPGRYIVAGAQGPKRSGLVQAPPGLPSNPDILSSSAFRLTHRRPGTVSLNLSENEDDDYLRSNQGYRNLGLLITTGPGPVPSLDGENIVLGRVAEGLDVLDAITQVPTFTPDDTARAYNQFASFIGDDRADKTRRKWGRPLRAVLITRAGLL